MKIKSGVVGLAALFGLAVSQSAVASLVDAVEYQYSGHYFMTAFPDEIAAIDTGAIPGWTRTGYSFKVQTEAASSAYVPVCRFYSIGVTRGSHFYTGDAGECSGLKGDANWKYEADAFFAQPATGGSCPTGKVPVYRLYNNRLSGAPNHRYTADLNVRADMTTKGWTAEGVAFCAEASGSNPPADPALAQRMTSKMSGGTWTLSYTYGGTLNVDVLAFTTVVSDPASTASPYYAQGSNQYGLPATARYNLQTGQMEVRSSFVIPATDFYSLQFNTDNAVAGCYYFMPTNAASPSGNCASVTGTRK